MNIDWNSLQPLDNSLNTAFEELCCQLASGEGVPTGSTFKRKGAPDAGVECFWKLPDGKEWGWQAKFFRVLGEAQWRQLDKSVETALEKHPDLGSYTICLPLNLRDPRIPDRTDLLERWESRVKKWRGWASARGLSVEFPYWGEHQILERLSRDEHRGRYFFWFHKEFFSKEWLADLVDVAIANAGPRYTPELHVGLPVAEVFEGLGRTRVFFDQIKVLHNQLRKTYGSLRLDTPHPAASQQLTTLDEQLQKLFALLARLPESRVTFIDFSAVACSCEQINTSIWEAERLLEEAKRVRASDHAGKVESQRQGSQHETDFSKHYLRELFRQIRELEAIADSKSAQLANTPALLLTGAVGTGKSHLFCDVAKHRIADGLPTVLLLGESFSTGDPWMQIIRMLELTCSKDEFLGALEAAAQAGGARALIMIDALNEGEGKQLWHRSIAGMLKLLERNPWIGLAVSVRSSYESSVIPSELVPGRLIRVEHTGFSGHELEATTTFFDFYKIKAPSVPLLSPEFQNPLFLKLFCKGLENQDLNEIPRGLQGITAIFDFFIESANSKLSKILDYDPASDPVRKAINALAQLMAAHGDTQIPRVDANAAVYSVLPTSSWEKSLFRHLISEGIIAEDRRLTSWEDKEWTDIVRFSYERLSDHLVTQFLIDRHLDNRDPFGSFASEQPLGALVRDEHSCLLNRGIIEALCIQLPERIGRELFDLAPQCANWQPPLEAFIDSLIWRSLKSFGETFLEHLRQTVNRSDQLFRQFLEGLLIVATNPDHPLNADFLDRMLKKGSMAKRDEWWSTFLHRQYSGYDASAVRRLVDWGWSLSDKSHISDESVRLCGVALSWFLTSSNRFLRDSSTKALVCLFTSRVPVLRQLLHQFQSVNDSYVLERLYALAYGCALRSTERNEIGPLAADVYEQVFRNGSPPVHILLRDYARGVIELALQLDIDLPIELNRIRPPYRSTWPVDIPAKDEVDVWAKKLSGSDEVRTRIYSSVLEWGDFASYVIGTNGGYFDWTSRTISEASKPTNKESYHRFKDSLTDRQQKTWQRYERIRQHVDYFMRSDEATRREDFGDEITKELCEQVLTLEEQRLRKKLGKKKAEVFDNHIIPYLNNPDRSDEHRFDLSIAQRFVLKRVVELGWQQEMFGEFDDNVNRYIDTYRSEHKAERIGKKYQWIAWHEFLARVADNFEYRPDHWSGRSEVYGGPWSDFVRDIDPSCLLPKTGYESWPEQHKTTWWIPEAQTDWGRPWVDHDPDEEWIKRTDNLPRCESLIEVVNSDGSRWLSLDLFEKWRQPVPVGEDEDRSWRKQFYLFLFSYLVRKCDSDVVIEWMQQQDFFGRWMPEPRELYYRHVFLGEFFRSTAYKSFSIPYYGHEGWTRGRNECIPKPVCVTTEEYFCEGNNLDCSIEEGYRIKMPGTLIAEEMKLRWQGVEGEFYDDNRRLIAVDPSVRNRGPSAFLIRKENFVQFLEEKGYDVLWTVLGEKMNWNALGSVTRAKQLGRLMLSGAYRLTEAGVSGRLNTRFDESWASN